MSRIVETYNPVEQAPASLLGLLHQDADGSLLFNNVVMPHLLTAYSVWRQYEVARIGDNHSQRKSLGRADTYMNMVLIPNLQFVYSLGMRGSRMVQTIEKGFDDYEIFAATHGTSTAAFYTVLEMLTKLSPDQFHADVVPDNRKVDFEQVSDGWTNTMNFRNWRNFEQRTRESSGVGIPFAMEFVDRQIAFPRAIVAGELVWEKRFDRYLLPTFVKQTKYRNSFYAYFAEKYEASADMNIKKAVFRKIYELMPGDDIAVLDAGCGTGLGFVNKPGNRNIRLVGVDSSPEMVQIAAMRGANVSVGNLEDVGLHADGDFDCAMMSFVDYWVANDAKEAVFNALKKSIKSGGKLVFNVHKPQEGWKEKYSKLLLDTCRYRTIEFIEEPIDRTDGGVYTAYYVVAEV